MFGENNASILNSEPNPIQIRPALADIDAQPIAAIYRPFVEESAISFEEQAPDATEMAERIRKVQQRHLWLVADQEGEVAGYAYATDWRSRFAYRFVCEVSVYVAPGFRRKGIARELYRELHRQLAAKGFTRSYAIMTLPNNPSREFHLRFGYEPKTVFEACGHKFGKWWDTEWMELVLSEYRN